MSNIQDDLLVKYEVHKTARNMWEALKAKYRGLSVTKLNELNIKFGSYRVRRNHTIKQHLREIKKMIREFKTSRHILTNEQ